MKFKIGDEVIDLPWSNHNSIRRTGKIVPIEYDEYSSDEVYRVQFYNLTHLDYSEDRKILGTYNLSDLRLLTKLEKVLK